MTGGFDFADGTWLKSLGAVSTCYLETKKLIRYAGLREEMRSAIRPKRLPRGPNLNWQLLHGRQIAVPLARSYF